MPLSGTELLVMTAIGCAVLCHEDTDNILQYNLVSIDIEKDLFMDLFIELLLYSTIMNSQLVYCSINSFIIHFLTYFIST